MTASNPPVVLHARVVSGAGGGPEKTILNSPRFLASAGYRVLCAYMHPPNDPGFEQLERRAESFAAPLIPVLDRGPLDWQVVPQLLEICRREQVRIWHGHDYKSNLIGLVLRRSWPMRLVTTVHGWVEKTRRTPLYYWIDRLTLPFYEKVICVSPDLYQQCRDHGVPASRCILVENAIDTDQYARRIDVADAKKRQGIDPKRLVVGAVGRLSAEKGFDLLIRAADALIRDGQNLELLIIGDGPEKLRLQDQVSSLATDRIRLLGYQADPVQWFEAMDAFALSSLREGLPNVVLEAMALEVPVVATRIAGVPRLIQHEENGLLVEPNDLDALTKSLGRMLADTQLRNRLQKAGRRTVEMNYSFAKRMEKIRLIYDDLLRDE